MAALLSAVAVLFLGACGTQVAGQGGETSPSPTATAPIPWTSMESSTVTGARLTGDRRTLILDAQVPSGEHPCVRDLGAADPGPAHQRVGAAALSGRPCCPRRALRGGPASATDSSSSSTPVRAQSRTVRPISTGDAEPRTCSAASSAESSRQSSKVPRARSETSSPGPFVRAVRHRRSSGSVPPDRTMPGPVVPVTRMSSSTVRADKERWMPTLVSWTTVRSTWVVRCSSSAMDPLAAESLRHPVTDIVRSGILKPPQPLASDSRNPGDRHRLGSSASPGRARKPPGGAAHTPRARPSQRPTGRRAPS